MLPSCTVNISMSLYWGPALRLFAGYKSQHRPGPLIYDGRIADAITRLPAAPLLPAISDEVTPRSYGLYCE